MRPLTTEDAVLICLALRDGLLNTADQHMEGGRPKHAELAEEQATAVENCAAALQQIARKIAIKP